MWKLQRPPAWKKSPPPLIVEVLSSPTFLKIWLEAPPLPVLTAKDGGEGGEHYGVVNLPLKFSENDPSSRRLSVNL